MYKLILTHPVFGEFEVLASSKQMFRVITDQETSYIEACNLKSGDSIQTDQGPATLTQTDFIDS